MSLQRAWWRQLAVAGAAAALAPAAVVAALAVLALAGGFGGVGALRQVFAGPPPPPAGSPFGAGSGRHSPAALLARLPPAASSAQPAGTTHPGLAAAPVRTGAGSPTGSGTASGVGGLKQGSPSGTGGSGAGSSGPGGVQQPPAGGAVPPPTAPPPRPTLIDPVVSAATSLTSQVPGPVGSFATTTLQTVGATVDGVLAPPGSHGRSR